jgi:hypothetical protein
MLIVDFNSFIIYIKLFLLFYITKKQININLKNHFIYYSVVDISYSIIIKLFLYSFYKEFTIFYFIFYNFGMLFLFWQLYSLYSIIDIIGNKKRKLYYFLFLFSFIAAFSKLIIKIFFYLYKSNFFRFMHFINQSKFLFILIFICYLFFQFFYIIPVIIQSGIYLKKYKINKSLKKSLYFLLFIFFIKIIIDIFQTGFLEFFKILINTNKYFRKLIAKDSDILITISSFFSTSIYLFMIFFIKTIHKIRSINYNYSYLKNKKEYTFSLSITQENMTKIFIEKDPLKKLIYLFCLENIKNKYNFENNMFAIIEKNNLEYEVFFDSTSLIYQKININQLIYYDIYYDIYHANLLTENNDIQNKLFKNILEVFDKLNIRLIIPIYKINILDSYFVIFQNTFNIKNNFDESDFKYLFELIKYLEDSDKKLKLDSFYSKLIYENKIADINVLENNEIHENNYKKLNEKIEQIEQLFIYENNKNIVKCFAKKTPQINPEYLYLIHKNQKIEDKFTNNLNFIFKKNEDSNLAILSNEKIQLNSFLGSMYSIFPFFKKEHNTIQFSLDNEKINLIFPLECYKLNLHRGFFNDFYSDFKIKIIINNIQNAKSFYKIISYISQDKCIYLSLRNIYNMKLIEDIFNTFIDSELKYYIFFTDITASSLYIQKSILDIYVNYIVNKKNIFIKIFFLLTKEEHLSFINHAIIIKAKIITLDLIIIKDIHEEFLCKILKNYSYYILKKNYSVNIIEKLIHDYYLNKIYTNFYLFLDLFEKIIDSYSLKDIILSEVDIFYINQAAKLEKEALKNIFLMKKLGDLYNFNFEKIAKLLNLSKSTISKYYRNIL